VPKGATLSVAARSGNVAEPDDTWSDWSAEQADPRQASANVPPARFFQYRVTLATADPAVSPALRSLNVRHATLNQAPEVTSLDVPNIDAATAKEPKRLKFKWSVTDPNEDELVFDLYVRKDGWTEWVKIEEDWSKTNTSGTRRRCRRGRTSSRSSPATGRTTTKIRPHRRARRRAIRRGPRAAVRGGEGGRCRKGPGQV